MRFRSAWLLMAVVLAGCTGDPVRPAPSAEPSAVTPPELESRAFDASGDRLTMRMTPLIRSGGTVVLSVATTLDSAKTTTVTRHFSTILATSFDNVRLVDETGRRVYAVAPGADGDGCVCTGLQRLETGETLALQAAFTGVPATVTKMSVMLPYAGVFADVPVVTGPPQPPLDVSRAGASLAADLDAYTERLDVPLRTKRTPDRVEVSLDADVLFRLDRADLTPSAAQAVDAAVQDIEAGPPGPLSITGHTDDSGSSAHNQSLSRARAATVSKALTPDLPDAQWPKTVTGKGETEPAVPNTNAAARRLNRRVTIAYRQTAAIPAPQAAKTELPQTTGVRATALEGVEVALPLHRGTVRFTARPARIRGPFLQVDLVARSTGDDDATILDYLGQGIFTARDEFDPYAPYGASGVRMFDGGTVAYGLDYVTDKGGHRCLCDRLLNQAIPPGREQVIALWFPAPPPGTTAVTLDVPGRFRLTGVPVSGS